jgi:hypothetical protein
MGLAADRSAPHAVATSEDAPTLARTGRQRTASAVPRGDDSPSGHGRVHEAQQPDALVLRTAR